VAKGRIQAYGIATWDGLRVPATHPRHLSLAKIMDLAREAGGANHHLRVLQFPYNLADAGTVGESASRRAQGSSGKGADNGQARIRCADRAADQPQRAGAIC